MADDLHILDGTAGGGAGDASAANQTSEIALLTTIDADTGTVVAAVGERSAIPTATQKGIPALHVLDAALTDQTGSDADGDFTLPRTDIYGATWVQMAGALSASVDSVAIGALATLGCDVHNSIDLDESEEEVKATAGTVYGFYAVNRDTAPVYVRFYNLTAANVTVGTSAIKATFEIPYSAASHLGTVFAFPPGIKFDTAICVAATTGIADADVGAPGVNDVTIVVFFK